eukprot:6199296-Pleurochrysis_carterae.AAC.1
MLWSFKVKLNRRAVKLSKSHCASFAQVTLDSVAKACVCVSKDSGDAERPRDMTRYGEIWRATFSKGLVRYLNNGAVIYALRYSRLSLLFYKVCFGNKQNSCDVCYTDPVAQARLPPGMARYGEIDTHQTFLRLWREYILYS